MRNITALLAALALALLASANVAADERADHYKETVLYSFCAQASCADGGQPSAGLMADAQGNLYGTASIGGSGGGGTVFELTSKRKETVLYNFCSSSNCANDGASPQAGLIADAQGNLYGTTHNGGGSSNGTVFELTPDGHGHYTHTVLYSFCAQADCVDGYWPQAGLIVDAAGNLYGTTSFGGARDNGTVFELTPKGKGHYKEKVLYSFCAQSGCIDGVQPRAGLIADAQGNLYGSTLFGGSYGGGGNGGGTVFELTPKGNGHYKEIVLYSFCAQANCADGQWPEAGLIADAQGNLFGTTSYGGANCTDNYGCGTVFELAPNGTGHYMETVLYSFCAQANCVDGNRPYYAGLITDAQGNLYGTTLDGGANGDFGTVFELMPKNSGHYKEAVLHSFCAQTNCADGKQPYAGLLADVQGNLYGTTVEGGVNGGGTVFELKNKN